MIVEVRLFAGLNRYVKNTKTGEPFSVTLDDDMTPEGLLKNLGIPREQAFVVMVNGQSTSFSSTILKDGDRIGIFPPIGGG